MEVRLLVIRFRTIQTRVQGKANINNKENIVLSEIKYKNSQITFSLQFKYKHRTGSG